MRAVGFIDCLGRRRKMLAEKNLNGNNNCEGYNNHHGKCQRHQPYAPAPPKKSTAAGRASVAEKPATKGEKTEQQHYDVSNPYRHRLTQREHVIKNDHCEHDNGENETGSPRHAVATNTRGKLHKPRVRAALRISVAGLLEDYAKHGEEQS